MGEEEFKRISFLSFVLQKKLGISAARKNYWGLQVMYRGSAQRRSKCLVAGNLRFGPS